MEKKSNESRLKSSRHCAAADAYLDEIWFHTHYRRASGCTACMRHCQHDEILFCQHESPEGDWVHQRPSARQSLVCQHDGSGWPPGACMRDRQHEETLLCQH